MTDAYVGCRRILGGNISIYIGIILVLHVCRTLAVAKCIVTVNELGQHFRHNKAVWIFPTEKRPRTCYKRAWKFKLKTQSTTFNWTIQTIWNSPPFLLLFLLGSSRSHWQWLDFLHDLPVAGLFNVSFLILYFNPCVSNYSLFFEGSAVSWMSWIHNIKLNWPPYGTPPFNL